MSNPGHAGSAEEPLFFDDLIGGYTNTEGYVRREWLEEHISACLASPECRYVLLVGEPGAGKTGLMAGLAVSRPEWLRYFIRRDSILPLSGGDAASLLLRIGHQFAARHPSLFDPQQLEIVVKQRVGTAGQDASVLAARIQDLQVSPFRRTAIRIDQEVEDLNGRLIGLEVANATVEPRLLTAESLQYMALMDPAKVLLASDPGKQIVILVDALDEVLGFKGELSVLDWLEKSPEMPENVRFVLTSRSHPRLRSLANTRGGFQLINLGTMAGYVHNDARRFGRHLFSGPGILPYLADPDSATEKLATASEGNFAYLTAYGRALEAAVKQRAQAEAGADDGKAMLDSLLRFEVLPQGLGALYASFIRNMREEINRHGHLEVKNPLRPDDAVTPAWEGAGQRMLGVFAVAKAPLTLDQLMKFAALRIWKREAQNVLNRLTPFLDESDGGSWQLFHPSVAEFLIRDSSTEAPDLGIDGSEWHNRIVRAYRSDQGWAAVDWNHTDDYGLLHVVEHLIELGETGRDEVPLLVNPALRLACRKRFRTDLPFMRIVELALLEATAAAEPGRSFTTTLFLDVVRKALSTSGRWLPPGVFGLLAKLGHFKEAEARIELLPPGEHRFTALQALVDCTPAAQRPLLGAHEGAAKLASAALEISATDGFPFPGIGRSRAIRAAAEALAPHDVARALALAAEAGGKANVQEARAAVYAAAFSKAPPASALVLLQDVDIGQASLAIGVAMRTGPPFREDFLSFAEQHLEGEPLNARLAVLAGLAVGWNDSKPRRARRYAEQLQKAVQYGPEGQAKGFDFLRAAINAVSTVHEMDPALAMSMLDDIVKEKAADSWIMTSAVRLYAAWGAAVKCRRAAEKVLAYERSLGWYGPAGNIARLALILRPYYPEWASALADEAENIVVQAASVDIDEFEQSRIDNTLGQVAKALRDWDPARALHLVRLMGDTQVRGGSWDSFDGRLSALARLGIDAMENGDESLARQLLQECAPDQPPAYYLGRPDPELLRGGLYRPAGDDVGSDQSRLTNFFVYLRNAANYWVTGRTWRPLFEPADVARSVQMPPGSRGSVASWAGVVAAAVEPLAAYDMEAALDLVNWPTDPCERLIACAAAVKVLTAANDARASAALSTLTRSALSLPRYVPELDVTKHEQGPVISYLDPTVRARWEAALMLPPEAATSAEELTRATGSWYLRATLQTQRLWESVPSTMAYGDNAEEFVRMAAQATEAAREHSDELQADILRFAVVRAFSSVDRAKAENLALEIGDPGRALMARLFLAATAAADAASVAAACRSVLDVSGGDVSLAAQSLALTGAACSLASEAPEAAVSLAEMALPIIENADMLTAPWGLVSLATTVSEDRRPAVLTAALARADVMTNVYLRREVLARMFGPAALTRDTELAIKVARHLLNEDWQVLMEGLQRGAGPLLDWLGPGIIGQIDEALRSAQGIIQPDAAPSHLDAVAAPAFRTRVPLADVLPYTATLSIESTFLETEDLPGMVLANDSAGQGANPGDPVFAAHGGLRSGYRVWLGDKTDALWQLVDSRFLFPTAEQAMAYHLERSGRENAPEVTGARPVGEACRIFGGAQKVGPAVMTSYVYQFVYGNVVIRASAAQGARSTEELLPEHVLRMAELILNKLRLPSP